MILRNCRILTKIGKILVSNIKELAGRYFVEDGEYLIEVEMISNGNFMIKP
jgi:hypothetical protein